MEPINTKNFRIQVWFDCVPDKILLGTVSVCADDEESAKRLAAAHTSFYLIGNDNFSWQIKERAAVYAY